MPGRVVRSIRRILDRKTWIVAASGSLVSIVGCGSSPEPAPGGNGATDPDSSANSTVATGDAPAEPSSESVDERLDRGTLDASRQLLDQVRTTEEKADARARSLLDQVDKSTLPTNDATPTLDFRAARMSEASARTALPDEIAGPPKLRRGVVEFQERVHYGRVALTARTDYRTLSGQKIAIVMSDLGPGSNALAMFRAECDELPTTVIDPLRFTRRRDLGENPGRQSYDSNGHRTRWDIAVDDRYTLEFVGVGVFPELIEKLAQSIDFASLEDRGEEEEPEKAAANER